MVVINGVYMSANKHYANTRDRNTNAMVAIDALSRIEKDRDSTFRVRPNVVHHTLIHINTNLNRHTHTRTSRHVIVYKPTVQI